MTVRNLIKALEVVDPESEVLFSVGKNEDECKEFAKDTIMGGIGLRYLFVSNIFLDLSNENNSIKIFLTTLKNYIFEGNVKKFDNQYQKK